MERRLISLRRIHLKCLSSTSLFFYDQTARSVRLWVLLRAEISHVVSDKVRLEQMSKELSLDRKTTEWWKVTKSLLVQSPQEYIAVCFTIVSRALHQVYHAHGYKGRGVCNKNDEISRWHHTPRVTTKTQRWNGWQPPTAELCARGITLKSNFKGRSKHWRAPCCFLPSLV